MATKTLKEIAIERARKQPKQVEYLTEKAPILNMMPFSPSSDGLNHSYEQITDITGPTMVRLDSPLPDIDVSSDLVKISMDIFGGQIERGEDALGELTQGSFASYLARKQQPIFRKFGMDAESRILYDYFRAYAIKHGTANSRALYKGTGASNTNYSILAVRFEPEVCTGLYNPNGFGQGAMMDYKPYNGGNLYQQNTTKIPVYGGRYKSHLGVMVASPKNVGAMVNIVADDFSDSKKDATSEKIDMMLSDVRADPADTYLFMHPDVLVRMSTYKDSKLEMGVEDRNFDRRISMWSEIKVVTSYNFLKGTEADV